MANSDRAFSETEKVNLLAEILKTSPVPHTALLDLIYDFRVEPQWLEVSRPPGRSPQECQTAFDQLRSAHPPGAARHPPAVYQPPQQHASRAFAPFEGPTSIGGSRVIQPRPEGVPHTVYPPAENPYSLQAPQQPFKKRGRPSNAELEQRKREWAELGREPPPTRSRKREKTTRGASATSPGAGARAGGEGQASVEASSGTSSQRASFPAYSEPSSSSAGPMRRSPGTMEPPVADQRPPMQPPFSHHERSYSQPQRPPPPPPPPPPHHTPTQQQPPPLEHPSHPLHRLPSPPSYARPASMPMLGSILPHPTASPRGGPAPPAFSTSQPPFHRPADPPQRRTPPNVSSSEPMEH